MKTSLTAEQIANEFLAHLNASLTREEAQRVVLRNKQETDSNICHTHDFIDANQILLNALESLGLPVNDEEFDFSDDNLCHLTNAAWNLAASRFAEDLHGSKWGQYNILAPLKTAASAYSSLEPEGTGGGCDYVVRDFENGMRLMLMGRNDPDLTSLLAPCSVCLYFNMEEMNEGISFDFPNVPAALAFMHSATFFDAI